MTDTESLMWQVERDPVLRSSFTSVTFLDRPPDVERFRRRMRHAVATIPRLRQRVLHSPLVPAPPRWAVDPNFDLGYHLRWVRATSPGSMRTLLPPFNFAGMEIPMRPIPAR